MKSRVRIKAHAAFLDGPNEGIDLTPTPLRQLERTDLAGLEQCVARTQKKSPLGGGPSGVVATG